ncbi:MAG: hypothetical protein WA549_08460 [Thermoplasmata archaeon]
MKRFDLRLLLIKAYVRHLYWAHGRKYPEDFEASIRGGPRLYKYLRGIHAKRVLDIRPTPSYVGSYIVGALPEDGRLISILTDGWTDLTMFVPKPLSHRWLIQRGEWAKTHIADESADAIILGQPEGAWGKEAQRFLKTGGVIVDERSFIRRFEAEEIEG